MICPLCGSSDIFRVHAQHFEIIPRKLLGIRFYSCENCGWRGPGLGRIRIFFKVVVFVLKVVLAAIIAFLAFYLYRIIR